MREIVKTFVAVDVPNELTCAGEKLTAYDPDAGKQSIDSTIEESKDAAVMTPKQYAFDTFATGNWGCGAFGGDIPLKPQPFFLSSYPSVKRNRQIFSGSR